MKKIISTHLAKCFLLCALAALPLMGVEVIMEENAVIRSGESFIFDSQNAYLTLQNDGNLVLYRGSPGYSTGVIWASTTVFGEGQYFAVMQGDGNLVIYRGVPGAVEAVIWASLSVDSTAGIEDTQFLGLDEGGRLIIARGTSESVEKVLWSNIKYELTTGSKLQRGEIFKDPSRDVFMMLQGDCNLVVFKGASYDTREEIIWAAGASAESNGCFLNYQEDGNLVIRKGTAQQVGDVIWASQTNTRLSFMDFDSDLMPVVYSDTPQAPGKPRWRAGSLIIPTVAYTDESGNVYRIDNLNQTFPNSRMIASGGQSIQVAQDVVVYADEKNNLYRQIGFETAQRLFRRIPYSGTFVHIPVRASYYDVNDQYIAYVDGGRLYIQDLRSSYDSYGLGIEIDTARTPEMDPSGALLFKDAAGGFRHFDGFSVVTVPVAPDRTVLDIEHSGQFISWIEQTELGSQVLQWDRVSGETVIILDETVVFDTLGVAGQYVSFARTVYVSSGPNQFDSYFYDGESVYSVPSSIYDFQGVSALYVNATDVIARYSDSSAPYFSGLARYDIRAHMRGEIVGWEDLYSNADSVTINRFDNASEGFLSITEFNARAYFWINGNFIEGDSVGYNYLYYPKMSGIYGIGEDLQYGNNIGLKRIIVGAEGVESTSTIVPTPVTRYAIAQ